MNRNLEILRIVTAVALIILLMASCSKNNAANLREVSRRRSCRANMNTLCTDQANYCDANGEWASEIEQLNEYSGRIYPLVCPECGEDYILELTDCGYVIKCPGGHGSIDTGTRSWTGG